MSGLCTDHAFSHPSPTQGVGHLIWGYCKLARPPMEHIQFMLRHMAGMLYDNIRSQPGSSVQSKGVDAQVGHSGCLR